MENTDFCTSVNNIFEKLIYRIIHYLFSGYVHSPADVPKIVWPRVLTVCPPEVTLHKFLLE